MKTDLHVPLEGELWEDHMRFLAIASAVALMAHTPVSAADTAAAVPYDFKGVRLGITLAEFQALPIPDDYYAAVKAKYGMPGASQTGPATVSCSPQAALLRCRWLLGDSTQTQEATPIANGNGRADFLFVDAPDGQKRLATISVSSNMAWADDFRSAYSAKYGEPKVAAATVQNGYGASFDQTTLSWTNAASDIMITSRCPQIDRLCITYNDKALAGVIEAAKRKAAAAASTNL